MTYILSEEDWHKLVMAIHDLRVRAPGDDPNGTPIAAAALSLLAGLPKVQDDRGQHSMDPLRLREVQRAAKRYEWLRAGNYAIDFARSVLNDTPHGIDAAIDAAMKEHPQP